MRHSGGRHPQLSRELAIGHLAKQRLLRRSPDMQMRIELGDFKMNAPGLRGLHCAACSPGCLVVRHAPKQLLLLWSEETAVPATFPPLPRVGASDPPVLNLPGA